MIKVIQTWVDRYLSDPEAILLLVLLFGGLGLVVFFGHIFMPVFVSIAVTIFLQWGVDLLEEYKCPHLVAFWLVYTLFVILFFSALIFVFPLLWKQLVSLIGELPTIVESGKNILFRFVESRPEYISKEYLDNLTASILQEVQNWGKLAISISIASIPGILTWVIYIILVPLLVFFFLKDHKKIKAWFVGFLPEKRSLVQKVWREMNQQMGNYIRGKLAEIIIVAISTYLVFLYFDLRYPLLLGCLVGLSVVIPYVGVVMVTIPVVMVGYIQWGLVGGVYSQLALMLYAYTFVQLVDGGILVPLLFSEAVNLHPIAIIIAILFFGAMWGFWGVFFAIPLATLVKSVVNSWPRQSTSHAEAPGKHRGLKRHSTQ